MSILYPTVVRDCSEIDLVIKILLLSGGTNIVGATEPTPVEKDRSICSLDMRRMNRVLSIDKAAHTAVIEAGALGPDLEEQLHREGYSLGHDPDSFEYSTLGTHRVTHYVWRHAALLSSAEAK